MEVSICSPIVLWMTGRSGAGKTTLSNIVYDVLSKNGCPTKILDGDCIRKGLCSDLGFTDEDRAENIRRVAHVSKLFLESGFTVISAFISPFTKNRMAAREIIGKNAYHEIYIKCNLDDCIQRDPKGLYRKAINGELKNFTGIGSPYVEPDNPQLIVNTSILTVDESAALILEYVNTLP